jgi:hypothetical protein
MCFQAGSAGLNSAYYGGSVEIVTDTRVIRYFSYSFREELLITWCLKISYKAFILVWFRYCVINRINGNYKQFHYLSTHYNNKHLVFTTIVVLLNTTLIISAITFPVFTVKAYTESPYNSGYDHGCNDIKISNTDDRYIHQPGKGPPYHSDSFMNGYHNGFDSCYDSNNLPTTSKDAFKIIV